MLAPVRIRRVFRQFPNLRLPDGPPSLREARRLVVNGDVSFGADVSVRGEVEIDAPAGGLRIDDGTVLGG